MKFREIVPVCKSSDYHAVFLHECINFETFKLPIHFFLQFSTVVTVLCTVFFQMEDLDEHLLITKMEVSCWKDQLKQAVSPLQLINIFHAIQSILI